MSLIISPPAPGVAIVSAQLSVNAALAEIYGQEVSIHWFGTMSVCIRRFSYPLIETISRPLILASALWL